MASANTVFKKILNVKGIVVEKSTFYEDSFGVRIWTYRFVRPNGQNAGARSVADDAPRTAFLYGRIARGEASISALCLSTSKATPSVSNVPSTAALLPMCPGPIPAVALPRSSTLLWAGLPYFFPRAPFQNTCA